MRTATTYAPKKLHAKPPMYNRETPLLNAITSDGRQCKLDPGDTSELAALHSIDFVLEDTFLGCNESNLPSALYQ